MPNLNGLRERLRDHPECIELEILGETRPFLLTMYGLEQAREQGIEVVPAILDLGNRLAGLFMDEDADDIEVGSPEMAERLKGLIKDEDARTLSVVVWWGLVTFDQDLTLTEVQMMLTPGTMIDLVPKVINRVNRFAEDQTEADGELAEEDGGDAGEGKSPVPSSNESASGGDTNRGSTDG